MILKSLQLDKALKFIYPSRQGYSEGYVCTRISLEKTSNLHFQRTFKENWESDPFVVIKAGQSRWLWKAQSFLKISFFTLMGDADYLSSAEGKIDNYVMCWLTIPYLMARDLTG